VTCGDLTFVTYVLTFVTYVLPFVTYVRCQTCFFFDT